ncbi:magnesium-translocating P-type ATPase [candidate division WWE3 bacterium CG10_big_fil_rev_8_21_14_0_10_32_10]|uniref:Magnesium-transporting ATPase, P-type 1 n=1 Tax=candidate division WWE3 bacterium CG10_big_fil_rev_8_21_14_0_10_32_10 TaxID=1975090 RepID=A0A2H0RBC7_UNCKA|nr:MAG: magnesium-translocating P-type ATPase [candidate division WWE3 bacterium CG10_big_fil_rev_8_21_14_0_10_32_10]
MKSFDISTFAKYDEREILENIRTSPKGLSLGEAKKRIQEYGHNSIETRSKTNVVFEYLINFTNPLILVLLLVSIISFILEDYVNAIIVLSMVFLSVTLNFIQEYKANKSAEKLKDSVALTSTVIRDNKEQTIKSINIVPGDIIVLNAGDLIPADSRVIEHKDFFINQASLTGEAYPVQKSGEIHKGEVKEVTVLQNIVFAGTNVITGQAKAVVINTGKNTIFGNIAKNLSQKNIDNDFTIGIKHFSNFILKIIIIFVIFIFFVNTFIKNDLLESLTFAIAVAVGMTPEFLPMVMTVTMSKGAVIMAKKGVIVKKLTAIPSFGSMDILCTDKTGTITQDKIELVKYINILGNHSQKVLQMAYINSSLQTGINNPLDEAVKNYRKINIKGIKKIDEIPFDFERKRMSIVIQEKSKYLMITKGSPEDLIKQCKHIEIEGKIKKINKQNLKTFINEYKKLSNEGFRVLAVAVKSLEAKKEAYEKLDEDNLVFLGFTAFLDPVKNKVKETIDALEKIGVEIKVITGDNELVTKKACKDAGIQIKGTILGHEIDKISDKKLGELAENITIFARFSPTQKNRIINALRLQKHVVGYMGDGINDALSIKTADVGISVSNAVDVAKESADFILTHKNLAELKDGVIEGRKIFGNTMKYIMMGLSSNFGNMFSILGAVLFLPFLPMLPIQILLNNFLYDLSQITIPSDNVDVEYLNSPKKWNISSIKKFMVVFGPLSSIFDFITFYILYVSFKNVPSAFQTGWFIESLATQVLVIYIIRTKKIPFIQSTPSKLLIMSTLLIVGIGWIIPYTQINNIFSLYPLPLNIIIPLGFIVIGYLCLVERVKRIFYKRVLI